MFDRSITVWALAATLLAGCATGPRVRYDDQACKSDIHKSVQVPGAPGVAILIDGMWYLSCEAAVGVVYGIGALQRAVVHGTVYRSPDGLFSVDLPGSAAVDDGPGLQVHESITPDKDYVYFVPHPAGGPVYGMNVLPQMPPQFTGLSVEDFSHQAMADLFEDAHSPGDSPRSLNLEQVYEQALTLDDKPAVFAVYRRNGSDYGPYYLMYFVKQGDRAAILSVLWPGDSLPSGNNPEVAIRAMSPGLQDFVSSFRLASPQDRH